MGEPAAAIRARGGSARAQPKRRLRITEIFLSLQGEGRYTGWPTTFVRLTGCPLRCYYCDTRYAFHGGGWMPFESIFGQVEAHGAQHVCVTGGEPLAQPACTLLLTELCDAGYSVSLETSGALDIQDVDSRVSRVVDIKTPGSGECKRNRWENLPLLTTHDQLKFVLCAREDYEWARNIVSSQAFNQRCEIWFSPSYGELEPVTLADWIVQDQLEVRMQVQLHKYLWGDVPGR